MLHKVKIIIYKKKKTQQSTKVKLRDFGFCLVGTWDPQALLINCVGPSTLSLQNQDTNYAYLTPPNPPFFLLPVRPMKDEEAAVSLLSPPPAKKDASLASLFSCKNGYKFWVLAAILLLAFWSMFTGSVSLKWSSGDLTSSSDQPDFHITEDLDILEVEEREKTVRRMWDVYTQSTAHRLPRFWVEAFEAAYEYLVSDIPAVRDGAVSEIAKLSMRSFDPDTSSLLSLQTMNTGETRKTPKQLDKSKVVTTTVGSS